MLNLGELKQSFWNIHEYNNGGFTKALPLSCVLPIKECIRAYHYFWQVQHSIQNLSGNILSPQVEQILYKCIIKYIMSIIIITYYIIFQNSNCKFTGKSEIFMMKLENWNWFVENLELLDFLRCLLH